MSREAVGLSYYYDAKIEGVEHKIRDKTHNLRRLEAQRNELNTQGHITPLPSTLFVTNGPIVQ